MATKKRLKQFGELERAPDWYGTPLKDLDFRWSREEKLKIERYCEKILKNCKEEDMTPLERFNATYAGKPRDRVSLFNLYGTVYAVRTLDSGGDMIKPIDGFRNPKIWVEAELATTARFKLDRPHHYGISYTEEYWSAHAKMIDYGNPVIIGDAPIKRIEDLEGFEVPDPRQDGLHAGYLWAARELRRIFDDYGISKVMPIQPCVCGGPIGTTMMFLTGWLNFAVNLRKDPELDKKCLELCTQWEIRYAQAMIDVARPNGLFMCAMHGATPPKTAKQDNTWLADYQARIGHAIGPQVHIEYGYAFKLTEKWFPILLEHGALGWDSFCGGVADVQIDPQIAVDFHREHGLYIAQDASDKILLDGPVSDIEADEKKVIDIGKSYPRFCLGIGMCDFWTPQAHLDAAIAFAKKYGKY